MIVVQLPDTASDGQLSLEPGHSVHLRDKVVECSSEDVDKDSPFSEVDYRYEKTLGLTVSSSSSSCSCCK